MKKKMAGRFCVHCSHSREVTDAPLQCGHKSAENDENKSCAAQRKDNTKCGTEGLYFTKKESK